MTRLHRRTRRHPAPVDDPSSDDNGDGDGGGDGGGGGDDELRSLRLSTRDLAREASASLSARPSRVLLTALGTVLGIGALVATLAVASSAAARISSRFDALRATKVVVADGAETGAEATDPAFPEDADRRVGTLDGVVAGGQLWQVAAMEVTRFSGVPPEEGTSVPVRAADPGALRAIHARYRAGKAFNHFHVATDQRVVLLGRSVATRLGITDLERPVAVHLDGIAFTVTGIIEDTTRESSVLISAVVPVGTAESLWATSTEPRQVIIETEPGAAQTVGRQAPLALRPHDPDRLAVNAPPDPTSLRDQVRSDTNSLFVLLALVSLAAGTISIANTILVSVLERVPEIGLRRAVGARRRDIALQFLAESSAIGLVGGVIGTCVGLLGTVIITVAQQWTTVVEPAVVLASPLLGLLTGLVAGLYPALKASRIEPVAALRR